MAESFDSEEKIYEYFRQVVVGADPLNILRLSDGEKPVKWSGQSRKALPVQ